MEHRLPLPFLISLIFHTLFAFLGTIYMVQQNLKEKDAVAANIVHIKPPVLQRRLPKRPVKPIRPQPKLETVPIQQKVQRVETAVQLPASSTSTGLLAPTDTPLLMASDDMRALTRPLTIEQRPVRMKTPSPQIAPKWVRAVALPKVDFATADSNLDLDPTDFMVANLKDATRKPSVITPVQPVYPELARQAQKEGVVLLEATIGTDGIPTDIQVVGSMGFGCDQAAVQALNSTRFRPARQGKTKISVRIQLPYRFQLRD